jgi:hypothetical protein
MSTQRIDLRQQRESRSADLSGLLAYLAPLVGEPYRFVRVSYGDELTLHFGDLEPARQPKLKGKLYGAYILGMRASPWVLKSGTEPVVVNGGVLHDLSGAALGTPLRKEELESRRLIEPDSPVLTATAFIVKPVNGFGLQIRFSDGSTLLVLPTIPEPDEPEDDGLPELADWELLGPGWLLSAGPGLVWSFEPSGFTVHGELIRTVGSDLGLRVENEHELREFWRDHHIDTKLDWFGSGPPVISIGRKSDIEGCKPGDRASLTFIVERRAEGKRGIRTVAFKVHSGAQASESAAPVQRD